MTYNPIMNKKIVNIEEMVISKTVLLMSNKRTKYFKNLLADRSINMHYNYYYDVFMFLKNTFHLIHVNKVFKKETNKFNDL